MIKAKLLKVENRYVCMLFFLGPVGTFHMVSPNMRSPEGHVSFPFFGDAADQELVRMVLFKNFVHRA